MSTPPRKPTARGPKTLSSATLTEAEHAEIAAFAASVGCVEGTYDDEHDGIILPWNGGQRLRAE